VPDPRPRLTRTLIALIEGFVPSSWLLIPSSWLKPFVPILMSRLVGDKVAAALEISTAFSRKQKFFNKYVLPFMRLFERAAQLVHVSIFHFCSRVLVYHMWKAILLRESRPLGLPDDVLSPALNAWAKGGRPAWARFLERPLTGPPLESVLKNSRTKKQAVAPIRAPRVA
jgi:hypothetical protein